MKISNFFRDRTYPKYEFLVQLWPQFIPWRWPKSKIAIVLSRSVKIKVLSPSVFSEYYNFLMCYLRQLKLSKHRLAALFESPLLRSSCSWNNFGRSSFQTCIISSLVFFFTFSDHFFYFRPIFKDCLHAVFLQ